MRLAANKGRKKVVKNRHLGTIATKARIDNRKTMVNSNRYGEMTSHIYGRNTIAIL